MSNPRQPNPPGPCVKKPVAPGPKVVPRMPQSPPVRLTPAPRNPPVHSPSRPSASKSTAPKPGIKNPPEKSTPSPDPSRHSVASQRSSSSHGAEKESRSHSASPDKSNEENGAIGNADLHDTHDVKAGRSKEKPEIEKCPICLDDCTEPKLLDKCGHQFCTDCIDHYFQAVKPQCPCCFTIYGEIRGNQPEGGKMTHITTHHRLPGFKQNSTGTIKITYYFPDGIQDDNHPSPGMPYSGTTRDAYLPNNDEGRHVLRLLERAFELRQTFTVGQSRTTGCDNVVTWNDIHHKTSYSGGMQNFGYPDKTYLSRVQQELAAKGIK